MKLAIVGSRTFNDYEKLVEILNKNFGQIGIGKNRYQFTHIVSGGAKGADSLAARFAKENGIELIEYLPDWDKYGKAAGAIRNELIVKECDFLLAFWTGIKEHSGTYNDLYIAKRLKKPTLIWYINKVEEDARV